jgi:hypothetical protein
VTIRKTIIAVLGALTAVLLASCGGAGGGSATQVVSLLPAGDYIGIFGIKPGEIYNSGFFKKITTESEMAQASMMKGQMDATFAEIGLKPDDIKEMAAFMPTDMETWVGVVDAPVTLQKLMDVQKEKSGAEFEESDTSGTKIWTRKGTDTSMMEFGGVKLMGTKGNLEAIVGAEKKLTGDEAYNKAKGLVDTGASFYGVYWGDVSMAAGMFGAMLAQSEGGADAAETLQKMSAAGISIYLTDAIEAKIRLGFREGADVAKLAEFFNAQKTNLAMMGAGSMAMMAPGGGPDQEKVKAIADKISFSAAGNVLEIGLKLTYDDVMSLVPKPAAPEPAEEETPEDTGETGGTEEG